MPYQGVQAWAGTTRLSGLTSSTREVEVAGGEGEGGASVLLKVAVGREGGVDGRRRVQVGGEEEDVDAAALPTLAEDTTDFRAEDEVDAAVLIGSVGAGHQVALQFLEPGRVGEVGGGRGGQCP